MKQMKQVAKTEAKEAVQKHVKAMHMAKGGGIKIRGTGAAKRGVMARGPMG